MRYGVPMHYFGALHRPMMHYIGALHYFGALYRPMMHYIGALTCAVVLMEMGGGVMQCYKNSGISTDMREGVLDTSIHR